MGLVIAMHVFVKHFLKVATESMCFCELIPLCRLAIRLFCIVTEIGNDKSNHQSSYMISDHLKSIIIYRGGQLNMNRIINCTLCFLHLKSYIRVSVIVSLV